MKVLTPIGRRWVSALSSLACDLISERLTLAGTASSELARDILWQAAFQTPKMAVRPGRHLVGQFLSRPSFGFQLGRVR